MLIICAFSVAQGATKNDFEQKAEAAKERGENTTARYLYIRAYEDYVNKGSLRQGVECGVKASGMYYNKENLYKEAFDLLRRIEANC